jgi:FO synthase
MSIQVPPNLNPGRTSQLIAAGINDWGGVSPVTPDFVNPEAPWPQISKLAAETKAAGKQLIERLTVYPEYIFDDSGWLEPGIRTLAIRSVDSDGFTLADDWHSGDPDTAPPAELVPRPAGKINGQCSGAQIGKILARANAGKNLGEAEIVHLFSSRGDDFTAVCQAADWLRADVCGQPQYQLHQYLLFSLRLLCFLKRQTRQGPAGPPL